MPSGCRPDASLMPADLAADEMHERERQLFEESPKKWKNYGYRPVTIRTLGGLEVTLFARSRASHSSRLRRLASDCTK